MCSCNDTEATNAEAVDITEGVNSTVEVTYLDDEEMSSNSLGPIMM